LSPPTFIASKKISCSFSNIAIEDEAAPKSIQILPNNLSSELSVESAEDKGVGI